MLQEILQSVSAHPLGATSTGVGALVLSEILGFTRKGGLVKGIALFLIALGRATSEFLKAQSEIQEQKDIERAGVDARKKAERGE